MRTIRRRMLLMLLFVACGALAQDPASDAGDAAAAPPDTAAERDAIEPAVATSGPIAATRAPGRVMDEIELARTEITGNQELPKVLYIVPWQKSDPGDLTGKPVNTLLDEVLAPIDRAEFLRQVEYYGDLYGSDEQDLRIRKTD